MLRQTDDQTPTFAQKRKDDPSSEEPESSLFSVSKPSTSIS